MHYLWVYCIWSSRSFKILICMHWMGIEISRQEIWSLRYFITLFLHVIQKGFFFFSTHSKANAMRRLFFMFSALTAYDLLNMLFLFPLRLFLPSLIIYKWAWCVIIYLNTNLNSDDNWNHSLSFFCIYCKETLPIFLLLNPNCLI